jgi:hypothetical protein
MAVVTFDTLKFVKTLEAAGMPSQQAEAISLAVRDSHEMADLATKGDLRELKTELLHEISDVRHEIIGVRHEIKQLEQRMTIKLGSMLVVAVGVIAAVAKLL